MASKNKTRRIIITSIITFVLFFSFYAVYHINAGMQDAGIEFLRSEARQAMQHMDGDRVISLTSNAIQQRPDDHHFLFLRASGHLMKQDSQSALSDLDSAIKISPQTAPYYYVKHQIYLEMNDYQAANIELKKALELDPDLVNKVKANLHLVPPHLLAQ